MLAQEVLEELQKLFLNQWAMREKFASPSAILSRKGTTFSLLPPNPVLHGFMHKADTFMLPCALIWLVVLPRKAHFIRYWSDMPAPWRQAASASAIAVPSLRTKTPRDLSLNSSLCGDHEAPLIELSVAEGLARPHGISLFAYPLHEVLTQAFHPPQSLFARISTYSPLHSDLLPAHQSSYAQLSFCIRYQALFRASM